MSCPDGKCGRHLYVNITQSKVSAIIAQLKASGASVTGESPQWIVDTHQSGVVLCGCWDKDASVLTVTVLNKSWYVPCTSIWERIDSLMNHIQGYSENEMMDILANLGGSGVVV